ncbi:MAG TPA: cysteine dioxygenase family protein [Pyrinomonadaceae bacterium]|jgi:cysteine dioxygenase|nr:cysteine dioxygenase family protein [Pyrinomonadaceae bacterium]
MSTVDTQQAQSSHALAGEHASSPFTLAALVEKLSALDAPPALHELNAWLGEVEPARVELRPHLGFKPETYARHRVFINEYVELLLLCWRPGQRTPIHDHNGSYGTIRVLEGVMWETMFKLEGGRGLVYETAREWTAGQTTEGADVPDIHQIGNPDVSGCDLISLHAYAPPLASINTFRIGSLESVNTLCMNSWNPTI